MISELEGLAEVTKWNHIGMGLSHIIIASQVCEEAYNVFRDV